MPPGGTKASGTPSRPPPTYRNRLPDGALLNIADVSDRSPKCRRFPSCRAGAAGAYDVVLRAPDARGNQTQRPVPVIVANLTEPSSWQSVRHFKMFTAREATSTTVTMLAAACSIMSVFAQRESGIVSVGLKALAFVNDVKR